MQSGVFGFRKKNKQLHKEILFTITPCHIPVANGGSPRVRMSAADHHRGRRAGRRTRLNHGLKFKRVISAPLPHWRHAPPPIATPPQCRLSSPPARPSGPSARLSVPLPARPSVRPSPCPSVRPPARAPSVPAGAAHARAGARSSPRSGAAPPREGRAFRGHRGPAPRSCSGGRPGAGDGRRRGLSVCWVGRRCPCHRRPERWALARRGG